MKMIASWTVNRVLQDATYIIIIIIIIIIMALLSLNVTFHLSRLVRVIINGFYQFLSN